MEAEPSAWQAETPSGAPKGALPFAQAHLLAVRMDLAVLDGIGGTHLAVFADGASLADLRLAFCQTMARCEVRGVRLSLCPVAALRPVSLLDPGRLQDVHVSGILTSQQCR